MVDEASEVAAFGGIDDGVMVDPEHVAAADALFLIPLLPHVRDYLTQGGVAKTHSQLLPFFMIDATCLFLQLKDLSSLQSSRITTVRSWPPGLRAYLSDVLPHVLDHHLVCRYGLQREQAPVVDATLAEADLLLAELGDKGEGQANELAGLRRFLP